MPLMVFTASSMRLVISVSTSSADAPGFETVTMTVGRSIFGKRSTPRVKNEKTPDHHQRHNQHGGEDGPLYAEFGKCMHGLASFRSSRGGRRSGHGFDHHAIEQVWQMVGCDQCAGRESRKNLHHVAVA